MFVFNKQWIRQGFPSKWAVEHKVVQANYFRAFGLTGEDCEQTVILGRLLAVSTPDTKGQHFGYSMQVKPGAVNSLIKTDSNKKQKITSAMFSKYAYMLVFADQQDLPNCFTIILRRKLDFQRLFGNPSLAAEVTIGDLFAVVEPRPADATLGENMTIVQDPYLLVALNEGSASWHQHDVIQSSKDNQQVAFFKHNQKIDVSLVRLCWKGAVPCVNVTCDRQKTRCAGCFGKSHTLEPIVLQADVSIRECPLYNPTGNGNKAAFPAFRSLRFTNLFFDNISALSAKTLDQQSYDRTISIDIKKMVNIINNNGGWTLCGWHRRGVCVENDTDDYTLSVSTTGHLTLLTPTTSTIMESDEYKDLIIKNPGTEAPQTILQENTSESQNSTTVGQNTAAASSAQAARLPTSRVSATAPATTKRTRNAS